MAAQPLPRCVSPLLLDPTMPSVAWLPEEAERGYEANLGSTTDVPIGLGYR